MMVPRMTAPLPPVFSMNPASYENAENVDWAALAQQWIHMQDTSAPPPSAPPPPTFTRTLAQVQRPIYEEKGEADMEVDMNTTGEESSSPFVILAFVFFTFFFLFQTNPLIMKHRQPTNGIVDHGHHHHHNNSSN